MLKLALVLALALVCVAAQAQEPPPGGDMLGGATNVRVAPRTGPLSSDDRQNQEMTGVIPTATGQTGSPESQWNLHNIMSIGGASAAEGQTLATALRRQTYRAGGGGVAAIPAGAPSAGGSLDAIKAAIIHGQLGGGQRPLNQKK